MDTVCGAEELHESASVAMTGVLPAVISHELPFSRTTFSGAVVTAVVSDVPDVLPMITATSLYTPPKDALTTVLPADTGRIVTTLPAVVIDAMDVSALVQVTMSFVASPFSSTTYAETFVPAVWD